MRLPQIQIPAPSDNPGEGIRRLRPFLSDSFLQARRVINANEAAASTKSMEWFETPATLGYGVEYIKTAANTTICSVAEPNTVKVITGISLKNNHVASANVNIFIRKVGTDYKVNSASAIPAGGTAFLDETIAIWGTNYLKGYAASASITYTVHYSIEPMGLGVEPYNVAGGSSVGYDIVNRAGTGVHVILNEPKPKQRHLVRTVTLGNHFAGTPTTTLSIREISTTNVYDVGVYAVGAYGFDRFSHKTEGVLVLRPDTELILQHSADPLAFSVGVFYDTADVSRT